MAVGRAEPSIPHILKKAEIILSRSDKRGYLAAFPCLLTLQVVNAL